MRHCSIIFYGHDHHHRVFCGACGSNASVNAVPSPCLSSGGGCVSVPLCTSPFTLLELRSGRRLARLAMPMTQESANASSPVPVQCFVTSHQRDPPKFAGRRNEDVEDWLDSFARVSTFNGWDDRLKLRNAAFALTEVAETWYLNNASTITDWDGFTSELRLIFGSPAARSAAAKKKLAARVQRPNETYTSYIEDVLALCRRVDKDMIEADRVHHILKGIEQFAFTALALQNPTTVSAVTATCQRLDALQSSRIQPETPVRQLGDEDLRSLIRAIIREELNNHVPSCAPNSSYSAETPGLREIIKEELSSVTSQAPPGLLAPLAMPASYSEVAGRPPVPLAPVSPHHHPGYVSAFPSTPGPRPYYSTWRQTRPEPPANRPVCFYCGIRGHIARVCRRRQQDERRGYDLYERDEMSPRFSYRQQAYQSPTRRFRPPADSADVPRNTRESRRRSPSPFRRSVSPLRPVVHDDNRHSEN